MRFAREKFDGIPDKVIFVLRKCMFHADERLFAAAECRFADTESAFGGDNRRQAGRSAEISSPSAQPYLAGERTLVYQSAGLLSLNGDKISFPAAECGLTEIRNLCNPSRRMLVGRMQTDGFTRL